MCSQADHPPYDAPEPVRPRTYVLSGDAPSLRISYDVTPNDGERGVALAIIGSLLNDAEYALERLVIHDGRGLAYELAVARVDTLREIRDAVAAAEG